MYRVVLDTNVLVSAVIGNGRPRRLLRKAAIDGEYTLVTSDEILGELGRVLHRSEFRISEENIRTILSAFISSSDIQRTRSRFRVVEADPDDDIIINAAYDGMADFIVSGDGDLLKVGGIQGNQDSHGCRNARSAMIRLAGSGQIQLQFGAKAHGD